MKQLVKNSDGKYELVETGVMNGTVGAVVNTVTLSPNTGAQNLILAGVCVLGGLALGRAFGHKVPLINMIEAR